MKDLGNYVEGSNNPTESLSSTSYTPDDVTRLADAMWQLLDDMDSGGQSVCLVAKAEARVAFEPFRDKSEPEYNGWITVDQAVRILNGCDQ